MEEQDFNNAYDVFSCIVPHGKKLYSIPMEIMTPKLAAKLAAIPDAVYLAKVKEVLELQNIGHAVRMLLRFYDRDAFEAIAWDKQVPSTEKPFLICFTPRVAEFNDNAYVVLDIIGMTPVLAGNPNNYIGDGDGTDPSDLARDAQELDLACAAHEAATS